MFSPKSELPRRRRIPVRSKTMRRRRCGPTSALRLKREFVGPSVAFRPRTRRNQDQDRPLSHLQARRRLKADHAKTADRGTRSSCRSAASGRTPPGAHGKRSRRRLLHQRRQQPLRRRLLPRSRQRLRRQHRVSLRRKPAQPAPIVRPPAPPVVASREACVTRFRDARGASRTSAGRSAAPRPQRRLLCKRRRPQRLRADASTRPASGCCAREAGRADDCLCRE